MSWQSSLKDPNKRGQNNNTNYINPFSSSQRKSMHRWPSNYHTHCEATWNAWYFTYVNLLFVGNFYLWSKVVCLFCLSHWDLSSRKSSCCGLGIFEKLLMMSKGASTWFETGWSYSVEAIDYWIIFLMRIE